MCWFFTIHWLKLTSVSVADKKYNCSGSIFPSKNSFVLRLFLDPWWYFRCARVTSYLSQTPAPNSYHTDGRLCFTLRSHLLRGCREVKLFRYTEISEITTTCQPASYHVCLRLFWIEIMFLLNHMCLSELWRMFKQQKAVFLS